MENPLIKISNIKRFCSREEIVYVLKGIDLVINKGEYVALMDLQDQENLLNESFRLFRHAYLVLIYGKDK
jgi:hypothetical protein